MGILSSAIADRNWELAAWTIVYTAAQCLPDPRATRNQQLISLNSSSSLPLSTRNPKLEALK